MTDVPAALKPTKPAGPFSAWEFELALRYLRARRKEGGIALIAIISYVAIALAVMALIIVMSIMAGFRNELLDRMLSFNGHMYVQGQVLVDPDREAAVTRIAAVPGVVSVSPLTVGNMPAMAGRSIPGKVRNTNFDTAISAPVLPAETTPAASPLWTASTASHMLERRPVRSTWLGLASLVIASSV